MKVPKEEMREHRMISNDQNQQATVENHHDIHPGLRAVVEKLRSEEFPMDKQDIDFSVGDMEVEDGLGSTIPVRRVTPFIEAQNFSAAEQVVRSLQGALQRRNGSNAA